MRFTLAAARTQRRRTSAGTGVPSAWARAMACSIFRIQITSFQGQFFAGGLAAQLLDQLALDAQQAVDRFKDMHRDADGARLVGDRAADRLADPPGGIGAELIAARWVELRDCPQQANIAFLDQVQERAAAPDIALGDTDHQAQVGADDGMVRLDCRRRICFQLSLRPCIGRQVPSSVELVPCSGGNGLRAYRAAARVCSSVRLHLRSDHRSGSMYRYRKTVKALRATPSHKWIVSPHGRYPGKRRR